MPHKKLVVQAALFCLKIQEQSYSGRTWSDLILLGDIRSIFFLKIKIINYVQSKNNNVY